MPGPELDRERRAGRLDRVAGAEALGLLVDLDRGAVAAHLDDLAHEALRADLARGRTSSRAPALGDHERAGDLHDRALLHPTSFLFSRRGIFVPSARSIARVQLRPAHAARAPRAGDHGHRGHRLSAVSATRSAIAS